MEILQWIFLIGVAITIISVIFSVYFLFSFINHSRVMKKESQKKSKSQRKKRKRLKALSHKRKQSLRSMIVFLMVSVAMGAVSGYTTYYQATNLSDEDMGHISDGFYYLRDLKEEIEAMDSEEVDSKKSQQTINYVVTSLAGYGVKRASTLNTIEGQSVLNRYYSAMAELGINVSRHSAALPTDAAIREQTLTDIEKVKTYQKKALDFFKIDAAALEAQK